MKHISSVKMKGEMDGRIYKIRNGKNYSSKKPAKGIKKNEPELKGQYSRTAFLNELAGEINDRITGYNSFIKVGNFYQNMQSRFRKEPTNNRLLLLNQLKGMDINPKHPFRKLCAPPLLKVKGLTDKIIVELDVKGRIETEKADACRYLLQVVLLLWDDSGAPCELRKNRTKWIEMNGEYPIYDIPFLKPDGATDYMVCVHISLGNKRHEYNEQGTQGMLVMEVGSFNKKSQALLDERRNVNREAGSGGAAETSIEEDEGVAPRTVRRDK